MNLDEAAVSPLLRMEEVIPAMERALSVVVQEAYVHGVSTHKLDELVKALGTDGICKREPPNFARNWTSRSNTSATDPSKALTRTSLDRGHLRQGPPGQ